MKQEQINKTLALLLAGMMGFGAAQFFAAAQAQAPQTLIKTEGGLMLFMVDGQERARLDAAGLHINGDVNYSGAITDTVTYQPSAAAQQAGAQ